MELNILDWINGIIVIIGLPSILYACIKIGKKLKTLENLDVEFRPETKKFIEKTNEKISEFGKSLAVLIEKIENIGERVNTLWRNTFSSVSSPRKLNKRGIDILNESGIKEIIDRKKEEFLEIVKQKNPKNSYDAEQMIIESVYNLEKSNPEIIEEIKEGAFNSGTDIEGVLFVGGMYLRDQIFSRLGFSIDDIDNDKQKNKEE